MSMVTFCTHLQVGIVGKYPTFLRGFLQCLYIILNSIFTLKPLISCTCLIKTLRLLHFFHMLYLQLFIPVYINRVILTTNSHYFPKLIGFLTKVQAYCVFFEVRKEFLCTSSYIHFIQRQYKHILGAFATLRKATVNFVISVCLSLSLSTPTEQLCRQWTDFIEMLQFVIFKKFVERLEDSLKSDKSNGYFTRRHFYIYDNNSLSF